MSRSTRRPTTLLLAAAVAVLSLSGCAVAQDLVGGVEPERDEATGEVVEAVHANAFALRVGDCLNVNETMPDTEETFEVESVPTVPCGDEHDSEVYASHQMEDGEYPGDEAVLAAVDELCYADFAPFVGLAYEDSTLDFTAFFPSAQSWEMDDREILCIVVDPEAGVTGTLQGVQY